MHGNGTLLPFARPEPRPRPTPSSQGKKRGTKLRQLREEQQQDHQLLVNAQHAIAEPHAEGVFEEAPILRQGTKSRPSKRARCSDESSPLVSQQDTLNFLGNDMSAQQKLYEEQLRDKDATIEGLKRSQLATERISSIELSSLRAELQEKEEENSALGREKERVKKEMAQKIKRLEEMERRQLHLNGTPIKKEALEESIEQQNSQFEHSSLHEELKEKAEACSALQQEKASLVKKLQQRDARIEELEGSQRQYEAGETSAKSEHEKQIRSLEEQLETKSSVIEELHQKIQRQTQDIKDQDVKLDELKRQNATEMKDLEETSNTATESLRHRNQQLELENQIMKEEIDRKNQQLLIMEEELE